MHYIFEGVVDYLYAQAMYHIWLFCFWLEGMGRVVLSFI